MESKKTVLLYGLTNLGLIILINSNVVYTNQAGGHACMQPSAEGILTILDDDLEYIVNGITEQTINRVGLSPDIADRVDELLRKYSLSSFISVDRNRLKDSMEAWVYVNISSDNETDKGLPYRGFGKCKGVLTWANSD